MSFLLYSCIKYYFLPPPIEHYKHCGGKQRGRLIVLARPPSPPLTVSQNELYHFIYLNRVFIVILPVLRHYICRDDTRVNGSHFALNLCTTTTTVPTDYYTAKAIIYSPLIRRY